MPAVMNIAAHPGHRTRRPGAPGGPPGLRRADSDDNLIRRAQDGDSSAYAELTDRYGPLAYRVALRLLGNRREAGEVAREGLLAAWRHIASFPEDGSYRTWLLQIVTGRILLRIAPPRPAESPGQRGGALSGGAGRAREAGRSGIDDRVAAAVAGLPPPLRVAIVLHHFEGFSSDEVARITASTVPAVRSHLGQGRRALALSLRDRK
jgi:RNA polymerase sigma factor (sigma-70 family)